MLSKLVKTAVSSPVEHEGSPFGRRPARTGQTAERTQLEPLKRGGNWEFGAGWWGPKAGPAAGHGRRGGIWDLGFGWWGRKTRRPQATGARIARSLPSHHRQVGIGIWEMGGGGRRRIGWWGAKTGRPQATGARIARSLPTHHPNPKSQFPEFRRNHPLRPHWALPISLIRSSGHFSKDR
jgi:hypothetical protein